MLWSHRWAFLYLYQSTCVHVRVTKRVLEIIIHFDMMICIIMHTRVLAPCALLRPWHHRTRSCKFSMTRNVNPFLDVGQVKHSLGDVNPGKYAQNIRNVTLNRMLLQFECHLQREGVILRWPRLRQNSLRKKTRFRQKIQCCHHHRQ